IPRMVSELILGSKLTNRADILGECLAGIELLGFLEMFERFTEVIGGDEESTMGKMGRSGGIGNAGGLFKKHLCLDALPAFFTEAGEEKNRLTVERFAAQPFFDTLRPGCGITSLK